MDIAFQHSNGKGDFTKLFWPSFVTPETATLMAVTFAADYVTQGRTGRRKRG